MGRTDEIGRVLEDRRPAFQPEISVVIASVNGYRYIAQCLASLAKQRDRERAEVIVVEGSGADTARRLAEEYPDVHVIPSSGSRSIPQLRAAGIHAAKADIVVTTEDHCVFDENWYARILQAHRTWPHAAIGGAVENGSRERIVDWAAYICEYGKFMLPLKAGPETDLPGPNVAYKRALLEQACGDLLDRGVWENVLHERLAARALGLWQTPTMVVYHAKVFGFWDFLAQRYYFGRSFAAVRVADAPVRRRAFFVAISLLLPPLLVWRYTRYFVRKRRFVKEVVKTLPLLVVFACAWSLGEFLGYAFGDGGASLRVK